MIYKSVRLYNKTISCFNILFRASHWVASRAPVFVPYICSINKLGKCKEQKPARGKPPSATHVYHLLHTI